MLNLLTETNRIQLPRCFVCSDCTAHWFTRLRIQADGAYLPIPHSDPVSSFRFVDVPEPLCDSCQKRLCPGGFVAATVNEGHEHLQHAPLSELIISQRTLLFEHILNKLLIDLNKDAEMEVLVRVHAKAIAAIKRVNTLRLLSGAAIISSVQCAIISLARNHPILVESTLTLKPANEDIRSALKDLAEGIRLKPCITCGASKGKSEYTKSQWKKSRRQCISCQETDSNQDIYELHAFLEKEEAERLEAELSRRNSVEHRECDCPICFDAVEHRPDRVYLHRSEHWVCTSCADELSAYNFSCPICRAEL